MPRVARKAQAVPIDVALIRGQIKSFLNRIAPNGKQVGSAKWGVYAFFDYDGEPIYVGQTKESLRSRIGRHLTNQRTDAVAMNVLDPFEVAEIEVWPLWELQEKQGRDTAAKQFLNATEYTVLKALVKNSSFDAVLNEGDIASTQLIELPPSERGSIIPSELYQQRKHPDVRIARRATTIASLARVISERQVSKGLRRTLTIQARRLERLASQRYNELGGQVPIIAPGREV
jgi:hypothetical protein